MIGAGRHERNADRLNCRNGYRDRSLDARLGPLNLRIPKLRQSSYFPPFLGGVGAGDIGSKRPSRTTPTRSRLARYRPSSWCPEAAVGAETGTIGKIAGETASGPLVKDWWWRPQRSPISRGAALGVGHSAQRRGSLARFGVGGFKPTALS
jgi:hypothetical protein